MKTKRKKVSSNTLLHKVVEKLRTKYWKYEGPENYFHIDKLIKPIVAFRIDKNELVMNVEVKRDSFKCGYVEGIEKLRKNNGYDYCFDACAKDEREYRFLIRGDKNRQMASYILTLNHLPATHWTFNHLLEVIHFIGFERFDLPLEDYAENYKRGWLKKSYNEKVIRKAKVERLVCELE